MKTFRPVWPMVPKDDRYFLRNFGREAVIDHLLRRPSESSRLKRRKCSQCNFDFTSFWYFHKNGSRRFTVCEACEFDSVRTRHCSELKKQLKDLLTAAKARGVKFQYKCGEENQTVETPVVVDLTAEPLEKTPVVVDLTAEPLPACSSFQTLANQQEQVGVRSYDSKTTGEASNSAAVPSILELRRVQPKLELGTKRQLPSEGDTAVPPNKVCRLESTELSLGMTLARSCKQPIARKQESGGGREEEGGKGGRVVVVEASVNSEGDVGPISTGLTTGEDRRKGTPRRLSQDMASIH